MNIAVTKIRPRFAVLSLALTLPILAILVFLLALNSPVEAWSEGGCAPWPISVNDELSLGDAIDCFNNEVNPGNYVIAFTNDINLSASTPAINNITVGANLRIEGNNNSLDGQGIGGVRPISVALSTRVFINALNVTGGNVTGTANPNGGGIFNQGALIIKNSTIQNNTADFGGGIYNQNRTLVILNSIIDGNNAVGGGGGGVHNFEGVLVMKNSIVNGNTADTEGGAGILFDGSVPGSFTRISRSTISNNVSTGDYGAGIYASDDGDTDGKILIEYTTVYSNVNFAAEGSGIANYGPVMTISHSAIISNVNHNDGDAGVGAWAPTTIVNSTISGNRAEVNGLGAGGLGVYATVVTLTHVTIANNWMLPGADGSGGVSDWRQDDNELLVVTNSIIANNDGGRNPDCTVGQVAVSGRVDFNNAPNILENPTGCAVLNDGMVQNVDPALDSLADNGGPSNGPLGAAPTHAPLPGSPALDQVTAGTFGCGTAVTTDQRTWPRPRNNGCDLGAYEFAAPSLYMPTVLSSGGAQNANLNGTMNLPPLAPLLIIGLVALPMAHLRRKKRP